VLPEGYSSPQGSNTAALESKLDALIEQRTGKAEALPELTEVPEVRTGLHRTANVRSSIVDDPATAHQAMHRQQIADSCQAAQHMQQTGKAEALPELTEVPEVRRVFTSCDGTAGQQHSMQCSWGRCNYVARSVYDPAVLTIPQRQQYSRQCTGRRQAGHPVFQL
jgi:hypothetical protein